MGTWGFRQGEGMHGIRPSFPSAKRSRMKSHTSKCYPSLWLELQTTNIFLQKEYKQGPQPWASSPPPPCMSPAFSSQQPRTNQRIVRGKDFPARAHWAPPHDVSAPTESPVRVRPPVRPSLRPRAMGGACPFLPEPHLAPRTPVACGKTDAGKCSMIAREGERERGSEAANFLSTALDGGPRWMQRWAGLQAGRYIALGYPASLKAKGDCQGVAIHHVMSALSKPGWII